MEVLEYGLALLGGTLAGIINTLAGNGSAITLYILMDVFALPPTVANASNRLGILATGFAALPTFYRRKKLATGRSWLILLCLFVGALFGIWAAIEVGDNRFRSVFKYLLLLLLVVLLVNPKRWFRQSDEQFRLSPWLQVPLFLALGFYGGFIQMGMGVLFLMVMVLGARYSLIEANGVKLLGVAAYTLVAVGWFVYEDLIHWEFGLLLALGQAIGAQLAARFATSHPKANVWVHRLLVAVVVLAVLRLFFFE